MLYASVEVPEPDLIDPAGFLGVDMGIANIAYDSDGTRYAGDKLNGYRRRQLRLRKRLQEKDTKSARRLLARRNKKESRHATDVNHRIAKTIVTEAVRTGRGIAVEELTGIRDRVRLRKPQRVTLSSWSFHQLGSFLSYKARRTVYRWSRSTRATPPRPATAAVTATSATGRTRKPSSVGRAGSLPTPITMRPSTSPSAASRAGAQSTAHTRHHLAASEGA